MCQHGYNKYYPSLRVTNEPDDFDRVGKKYQKQNPKLSNQQARQKAIENMTYSLGEDDW